MGVCDGVPAGAGVPGLDEDALSPFVAAVVVTSAGAVTATATASGAGVLDDGAGDSFTGVSSLTEVGSIIFRSRSGETFKVTIDDLPVDDLRRSFSLAGGVVFAVPAILSVELDVTA